MKHLYIIGNGFDMHHDMKTGYWQFRQWLEDNDMSVLCTIDELFGGCDDEWWQHFEKNLATAVTSEIVQEEVRENYPDFASDDFRDADWYAAEYAVENRLADAYDEIRDAFQTWVAGLETGNPLKKIEIITEDSVFLTFNYTRTLETLYEIPSDKVLHIHGKAGSGEVLVLGHGATQKEIEEMLESEYPEDDEGDDFITQRAKDAAVGGVYSQRKNTDNIINAHEAWFNSLTDVTNLYFYGHSFGEVDHPYFEKILSVVDRNSVMIEVNDFNGENKSAIDSFMAQSGIPESRYSIISLDDKMISRRHS